MKSVSQLRTLITKAGGTLEEDEGFSDTRIFQAVAPVGKLWACSDLCCLLIHWARGNTDGAYKANENTYMDVSQRVSFGLRDMREDEKELYATD